MNHRHVLPILTLAAAAVAGGCAQRGGFAAAAADAAVTEATVIVSPTATDLQSGCWATFYDQRNFTGDSLTLVGPVDLQALDRGAAQQLKRDIKSVATGPRANLVLFEKQFLSARSVGFGPGSREAGLAEKLGFGGRIESMQLLCR